MFNSFPSAPYGMPNQFNNQTYPLQKQEVIRVNGKNGAAALNLPPNSSVLLLDENEPVVWLKVTDGAGYPSLTAYSITPYKEKEPIDLTSLESRITRLEAKLNESNAAGSEQGKQE